MERLEGHDILVVDDSPTVCGMLSDMLTAWGHRVCTAESGEVALDRIADHPPDLLLLDVMMPEMDGYQVCRLLRGREAGGDYIPVLMLTAAGDVGRSLAAGADDFIAKPPDPSELSARVRSLLRLRSLHKALYEKNRELEGKNAQLHIQNQELEAMAGQLKAQNQQLEAMAAQLHGQNQQLEALTGQLRVANRQLAHLSVTDGLTEAHNHRHFQERLRIELARASRHETPLSCVLIDIDRFKEVNDTHGHQAGDHVLVGVVEILQQSVRDEDLVARYGGEEFVLLLPETSAGSAQHLAERLREKVAATVFSLPDGGRVSITISAGVVDHCSGEPVPEPHAFVDAADQALFRAKRKGRNRVEVERMVRTPRGPLRCLQGS